MSSRTQAATLCPNNVGELVATLLGLPFYEWASIRDEVADTHRSMFDATSKLLRDQWDDCERRAQVRYALTAAATEAILAMPDPMNKANEQRQHVAAALRALHAAEQLEGQSADHL